MKNYHLSHLSWKAALIYLASITPPPKKEKDKDLAIFRLEPEHLTPI